LLLSILGGPGQLVERGGVCSRAAAASVNSSVCGASGMLSTTQVREIFDQGTGVSKNVSKGVVEVLGPVVTVLACVARKMWQFLSGNELRNDRVRPPVPDKRRLRAGRSRPLTINDKGAPTVLHQDPWSGERATRASPERLQALRILPVVPRRPSPGESSFHLLPGRDFHLAKRPWRTTLTRARKNKVRSVKPTTLGSASHLPNSS